MQVISREQLEAAFDFDRAVVAIEQAYQDYSAGQINQPPVGHIVFDETGSDCHIKYGQIVGDEHFVVKVAMGIPTNVDKGLPTGDGLFLVLSTKTGEVLALLHDRMFLTDTRTGIGGAIASRLLARLEARRVLVVGTGVQAEHQLSAHRQLLGDALTFELWGRNASRAQAVADRLGNVQVSDDLATSCAAADIIVTTTAAKTPIIQSAWIQPGTHITAVGADAPGKQELETTIVANADVLVADAKAQCTDHGEMEVAIAEGRVSEDDVLELGDILAGRQAGRTSADQLTVADLTGLAAQDIAIAKSVLG